MGVAYVPPRVLHPKAVPAHPASTPANVHPKATAKPVVKLKPAAQPKKPINFGPPLINKVAPVRPTALSTPSSPCSDCGGSSTDTETATETSTETTTTETTAASTPDNSHLIGGLLIAAIVVVLILAATGGSSN